MNTIEQLTASSHAALAGTNPSDPFRAFDLELDDAARFVTRWVDEVRKMSANVDSETAGREFEYRVGIGLLAVGIQYGRTINREART